MASPQQGQRFPEEGGGDGVDRISGLPEELLLHVLVRLGCAREAARTAVLARRWRGLSTRLPEYTFQRGVAAELVEAALTQVTRPKLDRLHIEAARLSPDTARGRASSLLLAAARLEPEELFAGLILFPTPPVEEEEAEEEAPIELPCLDRTRSLALCLPFPFTAPAAALARLESLHVTTSHDIPELSTWPRLRLLRIYAIDPLTVLDVRSTTLEELTVIGNYRRVHIEAPLLRAATLRFCEVRKLSLSFSAPKVKKLSWSIRYACPSVVGLHDHLFFLTCIEYTMSLGIRTLLLRIGCFCFAYVKRGIAQEIARHQLADFSVLKLAIKTGEHAFGPLLLHLLQIWPGIRRLELQLDQGEPNFVERCPQAGCPCLQPADWKNEKISLNDLEEVTISYGFFIGDEEIDFLKLLFRCAPTLKRMKVGVTREGFEKVRKICEENPHVECDVSKPAVIISLM